MIVEQFRPGVMARLGLDYDAVAKVNPTVIYCSISGYGQSGSKRDVAARPQLYQRYRSAEFVDGRSVTASPSPDVNRGYRGRAYPTVLNILLGLEERRRLGRGRHLDVAMAENLFPLMFWAIGHGFTVGTWPGNGAGYVTGGSPRYGLYPTKDGRVVAAAPLEQKFWETLPTLSVSSCSFAMMEKPRSESSRRRNHCDRDGRCLALSLRWQRLLLLDRCEASLMRLRTTRCSRRVPSCACQSRRCHYAGAPGATVDPGFRAAPAAAVASPALGADNKKYLA